MEYCIIEYKAPTVDYIQMPLHFYSLPLKVVDETEKSICVMYEDNAYWFEKKHIKAYSH